MGQLEPFELIRVQPRLTDNAPERPDSHLAVAGDCRRANAPGVSLANLTWLLFWLTSVKPAASNLRLTSRYGSGLSGTGRHFYLDRPNQLRNSRARRLEMELQRLT